MLDIERKQELAASKFSSCCLLELAVERSTATESAGLHQALDQHYSDRWQLHVNSFLSNHPCTLQTIPRKDDLSLTFVSNSWLDNIYILVVPWKTMFCLCRSI